MIYSIDIKFRIKSPNQNFGSEFQHMGFYIKLCSLTNKQNVYLQVSAISKLHKRIKAGLSLNIPISDTEERKNHLEPCLRI